jgi:hypothetical protein
MKGTGFRHHNNCTRCPVIGAEDILGEEVYRLLALRFKIDVARKLCRDHTPHCVERASLERWLEQVRIDPHHVQHLPTDLGPGIEVTLPAGCGMPIIDGNHRAARALAEDRDFFVYVLSESETLELLRRSMGAAIANHYWERMAASKPHPDDPHPGDQQ